MAFMELKGKFKWANLVTPRPDIKPDKPPIWDIVLYPDKESLDVIRDLQAEGLKNVLKRDAEEDGAYYTRFRRPAWRERKGLRESISPPIVTGAPDPSKLGNGSEGTITLDVYQHRVPDSTSMAKAARLHSVQVDKYVQYG